MRRCFSILAGAAALAAVAVPAAAKQYVVNGGFETLYNGAPAASQQISEANGRQYLGYAGANSQYYGWYNCSTGSACFYGSGNGLSNTAAYNMLIYNGGAGGSKVGAGGISTNQYPDIYLWGQPGHVDANACAGGSLGSGCATTLSVSPDKGNFLAANSNFEVGAIKQVLRDLTVGQSYDLIFSYAGAQQYGFDGKTNDQWNINLNNYNTGTGAVGTAVSLKDLASGRTFAGTAETPTLFDAQHANTGWKQASFQFTATGTTQLLSFLAEGTPDGKPPFALLDGVSVTEHLTQAVPEPGTWATMLAGFGILGGALRRRRRPAAQAA